MKYLLWLNHDCTTLEEITSALKNKGHQVAIILVQDGVYMLDKGCPESKNLDNYGLKIFALKDHIEERGISQRLVLDPEIVDYPKMIDLIMEEYDHIVSV